MPTGSDISYGKDLEFERFQLQARLSILVVAFCMVMLAIHPGVKKPNEALYCTLLAGIVGYWLPSPGSSPKSNVAAYSETTNIVATKEEQ